MSAPFAFVLMFLRTSLFPGLILCGKMEAGLTVLSVCITESTMVPTSHILDREDIAEFTSILSSTRFPNFPRLPSVLVENSNFYREMNACSEIFV